MTTAKTFKQQASIIEMIAEAERFENWLDTIRGINAGSNRYTVTIESGGQKRECMGTFGPERWASVDLESRELGTERINEIVLKAEHLMREPRQIYGTMTHEHVHKENSDTKCKDCSDSGSHNKIFKSVGEEHGLVVTHGKDLPAQGFEARPGKGYAFTELSDEMWERIQTEFKPHIEVWDMARQEPTKEKKAASSATLKCDCLGGKEEPASITMSRGAIQTRIDRNTEIICPACNGKFIVRD